MGLLKCDEALTRARHRRPVLAKSISRPVSFYSPECYRDLQRQSAYPSARSQRRIDRASEVINASRTDSAPPSFRGIVGLVRRD